MSSTTNERIRHSEGRLHHSNRYIADRPSSVRAVHVGQSILGYSHLGAALRDDVAFARTQASVVEAAKDVWDRAEAITEQGTFLTERLEGFIERIQLELDVQGELDLIEDTRTTLALDPDDPNQFSSIRQNAEFIESEVARVEDTLNDEDPNVWYSSIKQTADMIVSEVARIENTLNEENKELWYSSIKQTADEIESTVAILNMDLEDPEWETQQFSSIKQTADGIVSVVTTLNSAPDAQGQFSSISQNATEIASVVGTLQLDPDDVNQFSSIRQNASEIDLRVRDDEVIAAINISSEAVRILGERIFLDGAVLIDGGKTVIDGDTVLVNDNGNPRAALGHLEGLIWDGDPLPSGTYGIWTENGYFSGELAAGIVTADTVEAGSLHAGNLAIQNENGSLTGPNMRLRFLDRSGDTDIRASWPQGAVINTPPMGMALVPQVRVRIGNLGDWSPFWSISSPPVDFDHAAGRGSLSFSMQFVTATSFRLVLDPGVSITTVDSTATVNVPIHIEWQRVGVAAGGS